MYQSRKCIVIQILCDTLVYYIIYRKCKKEEVGTAILMVYLTEIMMIIKYVS